MTVRQTHDGLESLPSKRGPGRPPKADARHGTLRVRATAEQLADLRTRADAAYPDLPERERVPALVRAALWP